MYPGLCAAEIWETHGEVPLITNWTLDGTRSKTGHLLESICRNAKTNHISLFLYSRLALVRKMFELFGKLYFHNLFENREYKIPVDRGRIRHFRLDKASLASSKTMLSEASGSRPTTPAKHKWEWKCTPSPFLVVLQFLPWRASVPSAGNLIEVWTTIWCSVSWFFFMVLFPFHFYHFLFLVARYWHVGVITLHHHHSSLNTYVCSWLTSLSMDSETSTMRAVSRFLVTSVAAFGFGMRFSIMFLSTFESVLPLQIWCRFVSIVIVFFCHWRRVRIVPLPRLLTAHRRSFCRRLLVNFRLLCFCLFSCCYWKGAGFISSDWTLPTSYEISKLYSGIFPIPKVDNIFSINSV